MAETETTTVSATTVEQSAGTIINVPITKGKATVAINTSDLPDDVYAEVILQGLKVLLNRGMSKITKASTKDDDELKRLAMEKALENVEAVKAGKIKFSSGVKQKKASGAVMTEARRIARNLVKDAMKRDKIKVSHVAASEITRLANELLNDETIGKQIMDEAKAAIEARNKPVSGIDLSKLGGGLKEDPKLVAKAEKEAAERKTQLSAKQAGLTAKSKPKGQGAQATH